MILHNWLSADVKENYSTMIDLNVQFFTLMHQKFAFNFLQTISFYTMVDDRSVLHLKSCTLSYEADVSILDVYRCI